MKVLAEKLNKWKKLPTIAILKNASYLFSGDIIGTIVSMSSFIIISRSLGLEKLGLWTLVASSIELILRLFNCQSWQGCIKFGIGYLEKKQFQSFFGVLKFIFYIESITAVAAFGCTFLVSYWISNILNISQDIQIPLQIYAFSIFFRMESIPISILRIFRKFKHLSSYQLYGALIKFILIVSILPFSKNLLTIVWIFLISDIITGLTLWVFSGWLLNNKISFLKYLFVKSDINKETYKHIFKFLLITNFNGSIKLIYRDIDVFILKYFFTEKEVGILKVAKQFAMGFQKIGASINQVLYPELVSLYHNSRIREIINLVFKTSIPLLILAFVVLLIFGFFGQEILNILLKSEYSHGARVILFFLIAEAFAMSFGWMPQFILASGKPKHTLVTISISSTVYIILLFVYVPKYGASAVAMSFLVSIILNLSIMGIFIRKTLSKHMSLASQM